MDPRLVERLARQQAKLLTGESAVENVGSRPCAETGATTAPQFEPTLAARLARQQAKLETGESAVENVGAGKRNAPQFEPKLAERMARQQQKVESGESCVDEGSFQKQTNSRLDPVLAKRLAQQQDKVLTGKSAVDEVLLDKKVATQLDPVLAQRFARQREKEATGGTHVCDEVGSAADKAPKFENKLAKRLAEQQMKADTGIGSVDMVPTPSKAEFGREIVDERLAERMQRQRAKIQEEADAAAQEGTEATEEEPSPSEATKVSPSLDVSGERPAQHFALRAVRRGCWFTVSATAALVASLMYAGIGE